MCLSWITSLTYHICHISASWVLSTHRVRRYSTEVTLIVASWIMDHVGEKVDSMLQNITASGSWQYVCAVRALVKVRSPAPRPAAAHCVATRLQRILAALRAEAAARIPNPTSLLQLFLSTQSSISASECICLCFGNLNLIKHNISTEKLLMSAELLVTWLH